MVKVVQSILGSGSSGWLLGCGLLVLIGVACDPPVVKRPRDGGAEASGATGGSMGGGGGPDFGGNGGSGGQPVTRECLDASDCMNPARPVCRMGACVPCGQPSDVACPAPKMCNPDTGACVTCLADMQCASANKPLCVNNECVACGTSMETACSATRTPGKPVCNTMTGACVACLKDDQCQSSTSPFCVENACVPCNASPDITCAMRVPGRPVCDTTKGDCVQCLRDMDCPADAPVCTPERACRKCQRHTECANSGVCLATGRCAQPTDVIYVKDGTNCPGTGERNSPFCLPQAAIAQLAKPVETRRIVVLSGTVASFYITTSFGSPVTFFGQDAARVMRSSNPEVVRISGNTAVDLQDVTLVLGAGDVGLRVESGAQVTARQLVVEGASSSGLGIVVSSATLNLDRAIVRNAGGGGIQTTDSAFTITNSVFDRNGTTAIGANLGPAPGKTQVFSYNTILAHALGLSCTGSYPRGLVLYGNTTPILAGCEPPADTVTFDDPRFDPARPYHLTANSTCCVNRGKVGEAPPHDLDGDSRQGIPDLGADEL